MNNTKPRVFISYASEDRERFVLGFAKKLEDNGIDLWIDKWELLPGDSLIEKIFQEGIEKANIFIIILSETSVHKPWVREELNVGMIQRIQGNMKVIPVVIEQCKIPIELTSIFWERIKDINNYDEELSHIIEAIFNSPKKHTETTPPKYTQYYDVIQDLTIIDELVLKTICEKIIEKGISIQRKSQIVNFIINEGISESQLDESLQILDEHHYIKIIKECGNREIDGYEITTYGFEIYGMKYIEDFNGLIQKTLITIINENLTTNKELSSYLKLPIIVIDFILEILNNSNYITIGRTFGGEVSVENILIAGKRKAREA